MQARANKVRPCKTAARDIKTLRHSRQVYAAQSEAFLNIVEFFLSEEHYTTVKENFEGSTEKFRKNL